MLKYEIISETGRNIYTKPIAVKIMANKFISSLKIESNKICPAGTKKSVASKDFNANIVILPEIPLFRVDLLKKF